MEEVAAWFSKELAQMFDEAELKDIESHVRELVKSDGETHSAFHHRGTIPIEFKLDDNDILYIF